MQLKKRLGIAFLIFVAVILAGSFIYQKIEGWRFIDALYFTAITVTTVGYGDFTPQTDLGKMFTILFAISGISIVLYTFSLLGRSIFNLEFKKRKERKGIIKVGR